MDKYNNSYSRSPGADSKKRFNKRRRYVANSSGCNNSPRYSKYHNQSGYQYSPNRSSASDTNFQHSPHEKNTNRYFYGNSPKISNYSQQQSSTQSASYSNKSVPSSPSIFSASTQNANSSPQSDKLPAKAASATITTQKTQQQQIFTPNILENANYYGYPYNYYASTYNADLISTASTSAFGVVDGMSSYMWQTITSTPPPKLPQQQPPLPPQQPPAPPPLPSPDRPHLLPPPPIPSSIIDSTFPPSTTEYLDQNLSNPKDSGTKTIVKMKTKRKSMSMRYKLSKMWSKKDALLALKTEEANARKLQKDFIMVIRFPDPEISHEIVKSYSPDIESVHFQLNFAPRYCLIHLKPGTDVEKTIDHLSKIQFGTGYLSVEIKQIPNKPHNTKLNEIDPFTLYVGNLPTTIVCNSLKEHFPGAARIDIGFSQRMKYTRYAFIRYKNVHLAIEAYKRMLDAEIDGRTVTIRFRRLTSASDGSKDAEPENNDDVADGLIGQSTVTVDESEGNAKDVAHTDGDGDDGDHVATTASSVDKSQTAAGCEHEPNDKDTNKNTGNPPQQEANSMQGDLTTSNESTASPLGTNRAEETTSQTHSNSNINIKPDPDEDPNDVVIRYKPVRSRCEENDSSIKQEQENLALYEEFFERPQNQSDISAKSNRSDRNSLTSTTDDTDTISQISSNSLGEFLQTCQKSQKQTTSNSKDGEPPTKINKVTIKSEPLELDNVANKRNSALISKDVVSVGCVKQEVEESIENLNNSEESNRSVKSRKRAANTKAPEDSLNLNDDTVPPTALFFTSDYHNKWKNSRNNCENEGFYDEFYETSVSTQASTSQAKVKTESLVTTTNVSTNERHKKPQQVQPQNRSNAVSNNNICLENMNGNLPTTLSHAVDDDDDLVPAQNLLGSYRPHRNVIKHETEYDDIFSVPFSKSGGSQTNDDAVSLTNTTSQINECANMAEVSKSHLAESYDDDVVVISANIPPASKEKKSADPVYNNLAIPRLTDLVSFNYKPISATISNREVSTLLIRDHLDELYDQLNADSDGEL